MNKNQHEEAEITIRELLAVILRNGQRVFVLALALAMLFGVYGVIMNNGGDKMKEQEYQIALDVYNLTKIQRETNIERLTEETADQIVYNKESLLMKVNPRNKVETTITFAISGIDVSGVQDFFAFDETPISYMTQRIQTQYVTLWRLMNMEELVAGTDYAGAEEKYLRELITFNARDGGVMVLSVIGNDDVLTEKIAQAAYAMLCDSKSIVEKASYSHSFAMLQDLNTKVRVDTELEKTQLENRNRVDANKEQILWLEKELLEMKEPANPFGLGGVIKKAILGGIVGVALAAVWLVCGYLMSNKVTGSKKFISDFDVPYLGNGALRSTLWERMAQKSMGEYVWSDKAKALAFMKEKGVAHIPETATIAVVTSLTNVKKDSVSRVIEALGGENRAITFGLDATHNAESLAKIRRCSGVVLLERPFESKTAEVAEVVATAEELGKPVYGFVMV